MRRVVPYTNVLVSGLVSSLHPGSIPGSILQARQEEKFMVVVSEHILAEVSRTIGKEYFRQRLTQEQVDQAIAAIRRGATITGITCTVAGIATHPEDDLILATALSAGADLLVTGDTHLQQLGVYKGVSIVSPRQFLQEL